MFGIAECSERNLKSYFGCWPGETHSEAIHHFIFDKIEGKRTVVFLENVHKGEFNDSTDMEGNRKT